jgi:hypothetical protein
MTADEELAYEPPPFSPALLPSMALPDTVRVLVCKYSPPPEDAAVLRETEAPSRRLTVDDKMPLNAYTPPPSPPALLPLMELPLTVRLLCFKCRPPPLLAAVFPLTDVPSRRSTIDLPKDPTPVDTTPPPSSPALLLLMALLLTVSWLWETYTAPPSLLAILLLISLPVTVRVLWDDR